MLKDILSITGKSGLFKMISQGKNMIIVESLIDGKRLPAHSHEKIVSLGDIAIFTNSGDVTLGEIFDKIKEKEEGKKCSTDPKADNDTLRNYLEDILPEYDKDRVYPTDIKKMIVWYNLLIENDLTNFVETQETTDDKETEKKDKVDKNATDNKPTVKKTVKNSKVTSKTKVNNTKSVTNRKMGG